MVSTIKEHTIVTQFYVFFLKPFYHLVFWISVQN